MQLTIQKEVGPADRLARLRRVDRLLNREVQIPLACAYCNATNLHEDTTNEAHCASCGRNTGIRALHAIRTQRIVQYISTGSL